MRLHVPQRHHCHVTSNQFSVVSLPGMCLACTHMSAMFISWKCWRQPLCTVSSSPASSRRSKHTARLSYHLLPLNSKLPLQLRRPLLVHHASRLPSDAGSMASSCSSLVIVRQAELPHCSCSGLCLCLAEQSKAARCAAAALSNQIPKMAHQPVLTGKCAKLTYAGVAVHANANRLWWRGCQQRATYTMLRSSLSYGMQNTYKLFCML